MKRIIIEWGLMSSVGIALALSLLWVHSKFVAPAPRHIALPLWRVVGDDLHLIVAHGNLSISNDFEVDASGNVRPLVVDPRSLVASDIRRGDRIGRFTIPGLDLRHYRFAPAGGSGSIWSLELSLLIPGVLLFLLAALLRRRVGRLRGPIDRGSGSVADPGPPPHRIGDPVAPDDA